MNQEEFRDYVMKKPFVTEVTPFGPTPIVYKVHNKMFALTDYNIENFTVNLKCNPEKAIELRENYPNSIFPGYHMSKIHWNTVNIQSINKQLVKQLIDHSFDLVWASLPKKIRDNF